MDVTRYKQLFLKIESGKITKIVRDVIKGVQTYKQDAYEENKEEVKPITEQLEKDSRACKECDWPVAIHVTDLS